MPDFQTGIPYIPANTTKKLQNAKERLKIRDKEADIRLIEAENARLKIALEEEKLANSARDIPGANPCIPTKEQTLMYLGGIIALGIKSLAEGLEFDHRLGLGASQQSARMQGWETKAVDPVGEGDIVDAMERTLAKYSNVKKSK